MMSDGPENPFYPATSEGLARRLWELKREIATLTGERGNIETILSERMRATGEAIVCAGIPPLRLVPTVTWDSGKKCMVETFKLRFDRMGRHDNRERRPRP